MSSNGIQIPTSIQQSQGALSVVEDDYSQTAMLDEQVAKLQMECNKVSPLSRHCYVLTSD